MRRFHPTVDSFLLHLILLQCLLQGSAVVSLDPEGRMQVELKSRRSMLPTAMS